MAITAAGVLAGLVLSQAAVAPASADYYAGGMPSAHLLVKPYSYNTTWQTPMDQSLSNWYNTPTPAWFEKSSSASNWVEAASFADTWYGTYTYWGSGSSRYFRIQLNSRMIAGDATNFSNFVQSVFVHEMGHALSLLDNPATDQASIMKYSRDRNTMTKPQAYDISEVNNYY
jgi:hypothetical protein